MKPIFWKNTKHYYDLKSYWKNIFGTNVYKLQIDAGFTCPNRDGSLGRSGCAYCDGRGSYLRTSGILPSISEQIMLGRDYYRKKKGADKFIAYFQTFTNTYAPTEKLRLIYDEALAQDDIVGLSIGTRPDCISDDAIDLLSEYAKTKHIWVEYGIQSIHNRTLELIGRAHDAECFISTVARTANRGIHICAHIIIGLPGETKNDMLETAQAISRLPIDGIKIHSLLALEGTQIGELYKKKQLLLMSMEEYVTIVCDIIEILPQRMTIQRLTADGYKDIFIAPRWVINKKAVMNAIEAELMRRETHQGIFADILS